MGYGLSAVLGSPEAVSSLPERFGEAKRVPLTPTLSLVLLTSRLARELGERSRRERSPLLFKNRVPGALERFLVEASHAAPVAYVEAEFWGGEGHQAAAVWDRGVRVLDVIEPEPEAGVPARPLREGAINQALRRLGVRVTGGEVDEFDSVGLGRFRSTEEWLDAAEELTEPD
jgi:hypothetical protein